MTPEKTNESNPSEAHEDGSLSDDDDLAARDEALELARIEDFRHQALQEQNPLAGCVGPMMSRLMEVEKHYAREMLDLLANRKTPLHSIPELQRLMQTWLNLDRQNGRNANLYLRLTETKDTNSPFSRRRPGGKRSPNGDFVG